MIDEISARMLEVRIFLELSQEAFGKRIGLSRSSISKIEKGHNSLTDRNIKLISQEFGISEKWFRYGEGDMRGSETSFIEAIASSLGNIDERDMEIVKMYLSLDEEYRVAFRKFLKGFTKKAKDN